MRRTPAGMEIDEMKRIVVDSSASLYALDGIDFAAVPLKLVTDEREYLDDGTLDAVEMATALRTYKGKTSTSCPNIGDWLEAYEGADEIYAITITGTLSGSCNAAQLAAEEYQAEHPGAQVFVLDSLSAGPELVLLAESGISHSNSQSSYHCDISIFIVPAASVKYGSVQISDIVAGRITPVSATSMFSTLYLISRLSPSSS